MKKTARIVLILAIVALMIIPSFCVFAIDFNADLKYESVFVIYSKSKSSSSLGSGFAIGSEYVITNAHVVSNKNNELSISTNSGDEYDAELIGMDEDIDVALLYVEGLNAEPLMCEDLDSFGSGEDVYAIGAPKGLEYTITKGIVSSKSREVEGQCYIQTDAPINSGNSGGPLLNSNGNVIGINTWKLTDTEGMGFAIQMTTIWEYVQSLGYEIDANGNIDEGANDASTTKANDTNVVTTQSIETTANATKKSSSIMPLWIIILLGVAVVLIIVLIVYFVCTASSSSKKEKVVSTPSTSAEYPNLATSNTSTLTNTQPQHAEASQPQSTPIVQPVQQPQQAVDSQPAPAPTPTSEPAPQPSTNTQKYCSHCGAVNESSAKYCKVCGKEI